MRDGGCGGMRRDDWGGLKVSSLITDGVYMRIGATFVWMPKIPFVRSMNLGSPRKVRDTIWKKILTNLQLTRHVVHQDRVDKTSIASMCNVRPPLY